MSRFCVFFWWTFVEKLIYLLCFWLFQLSDSDEKTVVSFSGYYNPSMPGDCLIMLKTEKSRHFQIHNMEHARMVSYTENMPSFDFDVQCYSRLSMSHVSILLVFVFYFQNAFNFSELYKVFFMFIFKTLFIPLIFSIFTKLLQNTCKKNFCPIKFKENAFTVPLFFKHVQFIHFSFH